MVLQESSRNQTLRSSLDTLIDSHLGKTFSACALQLLQNGKTFYSAARGVGDTPFVTENSLFDIASVTKLFTTAAFLSLVSDGVVAFDTQVSTVLPEFTGMRSIRPYRNPLDTEKFIDVVPPTDEKVDAGAVTFRQLLSHSSGLPPWRRLYTLGSEDEARNTVLNTYFSYLPGTFVRYSDLGYMILGFAIERLSGQTLPEAIKSRVTSPLALQSVSYNPAAGDIVSTSNCDWRKRVLRGEVDDKNTVALGGIAGHAGLFSDIKDLAKFGEVLRAGGEPLFRPELLKEATKVQATDGGSVRGLGFVLKSSDPSSVMAPFSPSAYGHLGFTGTSLFIDPERNLTAAILTNRVCYRYDDLAGIAAFRRSVHELATTAGS